MKKIYYFNKIDYRIFNFLNSKKFKIYILDLMNECYFKKLNRSKIEF
jgi:hypothetical protein